MLWLTMALGAGQAAAADWKPPAPPVLRGGVLEKGRGVATFGGGLWSRGGGGTLMVGHLDIRYGLSGRVELGLLLPGIRVAFAKESAYIPEMVASLSVAELGFGGVGAFVFAYQGGLELSKRFGRRVRVTLDFLARHRAIGTEEIELGQPGPLHAARAAFLRALTQVQILPWWCAEGGGGYSFALGAGKSLWFWNLGMRFAIERRLELTMSLVLGESRSDRPVDPAFFGGLTLHY